MKIKVEPSINTQPLYEIYAILSRDKKGNCGIVSARIGQDNMPMVSGELHLLKEAVRFVPRDALKEYDLELLIVKYTKCVIVEVIEI